MSTTHVGNKELVNKLPYPFIPSSTPFKNADAVWEFLSNTLRIHPMQVVETKARFTNILLGRLQEPTVVDAIYSVELINQKQPFERYDISARWEDELITWPQDDSSERCHVLQLRIHEKTAGAVNCPIGHLRYAVREGSGGLEAIYIGLHTVTCVEELEGFRIFDALVGFDYRKSANWPYAVGLARDLRAWAGAEMGDLYDAFLTYTRKLFDLHRVSKVQVSLTPLAYNQVKLVVKAHRGEIQLAGFTTMVEFDEVLTKE